jgi:hypothetical protein
MGTDLGQLCYELEADFDWLRYKWSEFRQLFAKGQERIDFLNTVAPGFFSFLNRLMFEDAMLHLCRLTDPPKSFNQATGPKNLTVMVLADLVDPVLKTSVQTKTADARKTCEFARQWRNKRLAHTDLLTLRQGHSLTLPSVNALDVDNALTSISNLLRTVDAHYGRSTPTGFLPDPWGADSLLNYLEQAVRAAKAARES